MEDGTVCACGCSVPLTARTSSTWFASEACQKAWTLRHVHRLPAQPKAPADPDDPWADVMPHQPSPPPGVHGAYSRAGILHR